MKKFFYQLYLLAALLLSATIFTACSNADESAIEPSVAKTYQITVEASKGDDAATRALSLDGNTLNATWKAGEVVTVYNSADGSLGTLTAQSDGNSTTLKGTLTGDINVNDNLTLKFCSPDYSSQNGTLDYIATHCDYAKATVSVASITGSIVTTSRADFANQQAIVKFTLKDKADGTTSLSASELVVRAGDNTYTVTPGSATDVFYVAIPAINGKTVNLEATVGSATYLFSKESVTFNAGKYYAISVNMTRQFTDADIGKIIAANGRIYDNVAAATGAGTTAAGMIAYVGTPGNNLAIALNDETGDYYLGGAKTKAEGHTPTVTGGTWRLPSRTDWQNMFIACATDGDTKEEKQDMTNAGFRDKLREKEIDIYTEETYWISNSVIAVYFSEDSACSFQGVSSEDEYKVRAVLAF